MILIVDGNYVMNRSNVEPINEFRNDKGEKIGLILGCLNTVDRFIKKGVKIIWVWDAYPDGKKRYNKRKDIYSEYKANRVGGLGYKEDFREQQVKLTNILRTMGIDVYYCRDWEADDVIHSLIGKSNIIGNRVVEILTRDKDLFQLVGDGVYIRYPEGRGGWSKIGVGEVKKRMGVEPGQIGDLLSIVGDKSDNIPGAIGIGKVTAVKWINGDREGISERRRGIIKEWIFNGGYELNQDLVRLRDVELVKLGSRVSKGECMKLLMEDRLVRVLSKVEWWYKVIGDKEGNKALKEQEKGSDKQEGWFV